MGLMWDDDVPKPNNKHYFKVHKPLTIDQVIGILITMFIIALLVAMGLTWVFVKEGEREIRQGFERRAALTLNVEGGGDSLND